MTVKFVIEVDLTDAAPERMRSRLACIHGMPDGATLHVRVGVLRAEPDVARLLAEHGDRLDIAVHARNENAVRRWLDAIRNPDVLALRVAKP